MLGFATLLVIVKRAGRVMRVLRSIIACAVFVSSGSHLFAQVVDDDTKCAVIESITQTSAPDQQKEVVTYIVETMRALDRVHGRHGKTEILPQLTEDGRSALALLVTDRCRTQGSLTVADTAIETYEAIRAIKIAFVRSNHSPKSVVSHTRRENSPPARKWVHRSREDSLASAVDQRPIP